MIFFFPPRTNENAYPHAQYIFLSFGELIHNKYSLPLSPSSPYIYLLYDFLKFLQVFTKGFKVTSKLLVSLTYSRNQENKDQLGENEMGAPTFKPRLSER